MASWMPENIAAQVLTDLLGGRTLKLVLFSDVPTPDGAAADGVEAAGREPITLGAVTDATGARIMQVLSTNSVQFTGMLVGSSEVEGAALADATTGEILLVDDAWRPNRSFSAGDDFLVQPGEVVAFGAYV